jgi:hypothetical protein
MERDTVCSNINADGLLQNEHSELDKYVIDNEVHHSDTCVPIFCVKKTSPGLF